MRNLNEEQKQVVVNALYTAAAKYRECAKEIEASIYPQSAKDRLMAQFNKQADECSKVLELIEE